MHLLGGTTTTPEINFGGMLLAHLGTPATGNWGMEALTPQKDLAPIFN